MYGHMAELILVTDVIIDWLVMARYSQVSSSWLVINQAGSLQNELTHYKMSRA